MIPAAATKESVRVDLPAKFKNSRLTYMTSCRNRIHVFPSLNRSYVHNRSHHPFGYEKESLLSFDIHTFRVHPVSNGDGSLSDVLRTIALHW
eukprot:TRINITY_DN4889_c0_g1_i2.p1 TRINITY_DN4889_c0_g1~~TRINITY_DN4889_c0_g1_i2.p1  ORF type:complete len:103 (-),score=0.01 TRINITY_DN4889_c0_g1_i2:258-533(-)